MTTGRHASLWCLAVLCLACQLCSVAVAVAEAPAPAGAARRGFYMRASPAMGPVFLWSEASPLTGFEYASDSLTTAYGFGLDGEMGHGFSPDWLVGGYLSYTTAGSMRVHVSDRVATIAGGRLGNLSLGLVATHYPRAMGGWAVGLRGGLGGVDVSDGREDYLISRMLRGLQLGLSLRREWQVTRRLWMSFGLRLTAARLSAGAETESFLLAPSVFLGIAFF